MGGHAVSGREHGWLLYRKSNRRSLSNGEQIARLLRIHLGQAFDPERDWTSTFRERAGHSYFASRTFEAPFILTAPETRARMTEFLAKYGVSPSPEWQKKLNEWRPTYHVDVVCSTGGESGSFVFYAKWLERVSHTGRLKTTYAYCTV